MNVTLDQQQVLTDADITVDIPVGNTTQTPIDHSDGVNCRLISAISNNNILAKDDGADCKLTNNLSDDSPLANNRFNNNLFNCNNLTLNNNVTPLFTTLAFVPYLKPLFASNFTFHVNQLDHGILDSR